MQIEYSFLRSRVARRVFFLFILCALLPVGALSLVAFTDVTSQLTQQSERRVRQESKAMGMAVYQRLLLLEAELLSITSQPRVIQPQAAVDVVQAPASPPRRDLPVWLGFRLTEPAEVFLGEMRTVPSLSPSQWTLLRQQKTVMTSHQDAGGRRLFLARLPTLPTRRYWPRFVWSMCGILPAV